MAQAVGPAAGITVPLGQVAQLASQTLQAAGAQATVVQAQPANVAAPVTDQSPGSTTAIAQGNAAGAAATAGNSSATDQRAGQSQGGGSPASPRAGTAGGLAPEPASGGPAHAAGQASQTAQNVGAQATTVQAQPINVAVPIIVGSPGASIVIVQTNAASSGATAANSSSTTQTAGQALTGSAPAQSGQPGAGGPAAAPGSLPGISQSVVAPTGSGLTWIWNWNWNWMIGSSLPSALRPALPWWTLPGDASEQAPPARAERPKASPGRRGGGLSAPATGAPGPGVLAAAPETANGASSRIVQRPRTAPDPLLEPFAAFPLPPLPAPSAGSGFAPAGLLFGALAFLALYLGSLGLLVGRLSLASAPWRHQAHLAPLQRPG
jgi:hypothetical protein